MKQNVLDKFLRYVKIDTQSDEETGLSPSTEKQKDLGRLLTQELTDMGASDVYFDEEHCYVYAAIPATDGGKDPKVLGFVAHMDTAPAVTGKDVKPLICENYDGQDLQLNPDTILSTKQFPEILKLKGKTIVTTDGTTLLGADDKAGVAEIMTMAEYLIAHPEIPHRKIVIGFTPDEEIGSGVAYFDIPRFGADFAYTVDGGELGELEYECFNGAAVEIEINGVSVHPGSAKGKMINAAIVAVELENMLPPMQKPEHTEGYEGFFYLCFIKGDTEKTEMSYIIRDHDRTLFEEKKALMVDIIARLNEKYGEGTVKVEIKDSYYNMKEVLEPDFMFLVDNAKNAMIELGITPKVCPIRGGTDGAMLSYKGLPCPNLCTGGANFHGRFEYACVEDMAKTVELLIKLAVE